MYRLTRTEVFHIKHNNTGAETSLCTGLIDIIFICFQLVGATLLGVGLYVKLDSNTNDLLDVLKLAGEDELLHTAAILVIVVGALIFVVGFFGCCGACQESTYMLFIVSENRTKVTDLAHSKYCVISRQIVMSKSLKCIIMLYCRYFFIVVRVFSRFDFAVTNCLCYHGCCV